MKKMLKNLKKEQAIPFIVGLIIGLIIMLLFYPERIAELKNKEQVALTLNKTKITADELYDGFKNNYGMAVNELIEVIDKNILEEKYEMTTDMKKEITDYANNVISNYTNQYSITEEEFLKQSGYETREEFDNYIKLDYLRNKYYNEYLEKQITEDEIKDYYNKNVFGTITTEHILVEVTDTTDETTARSKAQEILNKLTKGTSWETLKTDYKNDIITETVTVDFDSSIDENYKTSAVNLKDGAYSKSLVHSSYGFHIIYRKSSETKPELESVKDRIVDVLKTEEETKDTNLYQKVMLKMREEAGLDIKDTYLKDLYKKYEKTINE